MESCLTFVDAAQYCVRRRWFPEVFLRPRCEIQHRMMPVCNAVLPQGSRSQAFDVDFLACPLSAAISQDSLEHLMMLWAVDGDISKFFAIARQEMLFMTRVQ